MTSTQYNAAHRGSRQRAPSADINAVPTTPVPPPRVIPLPEFYPTERTSTASFKAPVTAAGKKRMEPPPPPPPPGTLTTAISYISSPVKYLSSMFTAAPPPIQEPVKPKEKLFKIDLEKERDKERERQASPKLSPSLKKVPNVIIEEIVPPSAKTAQKTSQESAWRRKNLMEYGPYGPYTYQNVPKVRNQSPKRLPATTMSAADMSPTSFNQMTIASSATNQYSFRVMSKQPPEEPKKKEKKDPRKMTNSRSSKEAPAFSNVNKSNTKYNMPPPSKPTILETREDHRPIIPYPTFLPPRVPPATYSIKSKNTVPPSPHDEEIHGAKDVEVEGEPNSNAITALATTTDRTELVSCASPTAAKQFVAAAFNEAATNEPPTNVEEEEELIVQETVGKADIDETVRVSRLDQLPSGRINGATSIKNLFHDAKLVNGSLVDDDSSMLHAGRVGSMDVVLCSSSTKYPSPTKVSFHKLDSKPSPNRNLIAKRPFGAKESSISPIRKVASPVVMRNTQPATVVRVSSKDKATKNGRRTPDQLKNVARTPSKDKATNNRPRTPVQSAVSVLQPEVKNVQPASAVRAASKEKVTKNMPRTPVQSAGSLMRPENKIAQPASIARTPSKESASKNRPRTPVQSAVSIRSNQLPESKFSPSRNKEVVLKSLHSRTSSPKKVSPLRVEDKHLSAVEETIGKVPGQRRSRLSAWNQSQGKDDKGVKPNVIKKTISKTKDRTPEKTRPSSAISTAAIAAAATAAAAAAVTTITQPAPEPEKTSESAAAVAVQGDQSSNNDTKTRSHSPPSSWRMERDGAHIVSTPSPRAPSPKKAGEEKVIERGADNKNLDKSSSKPKLAIPSPKDFLKTDFLQINQIVSAQNANSSDAVPKRENEEFNCLENYCGDPAKFIKAATMMGEIP